MTHRLGAEASSSQARGDLDALRGLAALVVAIFHSLMWLRIAGDERLLILPIWDATTFQGRVVRSLLAVFNGATAVDFFFVLSGFALAVAWPRGPLSARTVLAFYVRRVLRLWPAYAASLLIVAVYLATVRGDFRGSPQAASWMAQFYREGTAGIDWPANLALLSVALNPVAWSLRVELAMSACLPGLMLAARHLGGVVALAQVCIAFFVALFCRYDAVGHFFYLFLIGAYGGVFRRGLIDAVHRVRMPRRAVWCSCVAALGLPGLFTLEHHPVADLVISLGALGLILCLAEEVPAPRSAWTCALRGVLVRYGKMAYSFYLCHFIVLYAVAWAWLANVPQPLLAAWPLPAMLLALIASLALSTWVARVIHFTVERPFTRWGHWCAGRIEADGAPRAGRGQSPAACLNSPLSCGPTSIKAQNASRRLEEDMPASLR